MNSELEDVTKDGSVPLSQTTSSDESDLASSIVEKLKVNTLDDQNFLNIYLLQYGWDSINVCSVQTTIEKQDRAQRLNSKMALLMLTMKTISIKGDSLRKARTHIVQRTTPPHKEMISRDRAATLPSCNSFSMDPAQLKCPVVRSPKLKRQRSKSTPDFSAIPYQTAICHCFSYKQRKWRKRGIRVQLAPLPFARGSSRVAFCMKVKEGEAYAWWWWWPGDMAKEGDVVEGGRAICVVMVCGPPHRH